MDDFQKAIQSLTAADLAFLPAAKPEPKPDAIRSDPIGPEPDQTGSDTIKKARRRRGVKQAVLPDKAPSPAPAPVEVSATEDKAAAIVPDKAISAGGDQDEPPRRQRNCPVHEWPAIGTQLAATYFGVTYQAEVITAQKRLKSGRQIRLLDGPARGKVLDSLSRAMLTATARQRKTSNLGRKGVASGWDFWQWDGKAPQNPSSLS